MLRDYQLKAVEEIRGHFAKGVRKALLVMPTGAGKTATFCHILKSIEANGKRAMMIVRGVALIGQASDRLNREGVPHGIIQRSDIDPEKNIYCASVDTLYARRIVPEDVQCLIIDEAHMANSTAFKWVIAQYPKAFIIAVTATPFHKEGFSNMADVIVEPITHEELIQRGFLVRGEYYVPETPDLSHVRRSNGDYSKKDLSKAVNQSRLFGRITGNWILRGNYEPTLMFAVSVSHSLRLVKSFMDEGIPALHIDAKTPKKQRDEAFLALADGRIKVLSSCDLLITGVDLPFVKNLIIARPTLSYNVHIQMLGRGTRPYPGKDKFRVFDHAGNTLRLDFAHVHRHAEIDGKPPLFRVAIAQCKRCFCAWSPAQSKTCPGVLADGTVCGEPIPPPEIKLSNIRIKEDVELLLSGDLEERERRLFIRETIDEAVRKGMAKGFAWYKIKARYGDDVARQSWRLIHEAYA